jgi:hypothetical protein
VFEGDHRSRGDPVEHQGPQQHGRRRAAGNAQVEQRDHGAAHAGVVGRFAGQNAFEFSLAEGFRMFGGILGRAVGYPAGDVFADAGHGADADADQGRTGDGGDIAHDRADFRDDALQFLGLADLKAVLEHLDDLGNAEGADEHGHHFDPAVQFGKAEGEPRVELQQIAADAGQEQSQKTGDPALDDQIRAGQGAADQDAEKGQQKKFEGGELQREVGDDRRNADHETAC